jgi:hypothetical protein
MITLIDMQKDRKVRENDCTTVGVCLFLRFGDGGGGCACI